jgi:lycopene beta-cyclase
VHDYDYILVGGGLQNGLIALSLLHHQPQSRIALVEKAPELGGNHTWCFHAADVHRDDEIWIEPLLRHRWEGYSVRFPNFHRAISAPYRGVDSETLHRVVTEALSRSPRCTLLTDTEVVTTRAHHVELANGGSMTAGTVIDARGPGESTPLGAGYQKFVGLEVELTRPHELTTVTLMDATVPQHDGFRFFYTLPFSTTRLLIEDTYFSDTSSLDKAALERGVLDYAEANGYEVSTIVRREDGVLPMPWSSRAQPPGKSPLIAGYAGGWFHPATGYSFPVALRLARLVGRSPADSLFGPELRALGRAHRNQVQYCQRLNRMLFQWFPPEQRWNVFARFYKLSPALIHRFYALDLTTADRARILLGRPPRGLSIRAGLARRRMM